MVDNSFSKIAQEIREELVRARGKHISFPEDPIHRTAIVAEEVGEAVQASLQYTYERGRTAAAAVRIREELIQCAAMCIRAIQGY
jgi:NTP pyrophosphatase (non-canonical NTP hydrolase)